MPVSQRLAITSTLRLLTNQKGVDSYTLLSDWLRDANTDANANR